MVDFPEERTSDGAIASSVISSEWVEESEKGLICLWPYHVKTDAQRQKLVINHVKLDRQKCLECPIIIKFGSGKFVLKYNSTVTSL